MESSFWVADQHQALTAPIRAWLLANYGYTAPAEHTYAALVSICVGSTAGAGVRCLVTFPFTFVFADALTGDTEAAIDAECRTRLLALRNAEPLASILGRRHWL